MYGIPGCVANPESPPLSLDPTVSCPAEMPMRASSDSPRTTGSRVTVSVFDAVSGDAFVWVALAACYSLS
jgi:hypothetical protein